VDALLRITEHRPLPSGPWVMKHIWHDLVFAHWPVSNDILRARVPPVLTLDTLGGQAWVAVTPFRMSGIRAAGLPALPGLSRFPELNLRSYVTYGGKPGVYFFSFDAANLPAVWAARALYHLPYFHAAMRCEELDGAIHYQSRRHGTAAELVARYGPAADVQIRDNDSIERWLTERYCLYTDHRGRVYRGEIHHLPWPLQDAHANFMVNTTAQAAGIRLPKTAAAAAFCSGRKFSYGRCAESRTHFFPPAMRSGQLIIPVSQLPRRIHEYFRPSGAGHWRVAGNWAELRAEAGQYGGYRRPGGAQSGEA
jgi:uncharacterized protein YqjF (DUF2071 family)